MFYKLHSFLVRHPYLPLPLILAVTVLTFLPTFTNGFQMEWDDQWMLINPITPKGLKSAVMGLYFTEGNHGQYSPINQLMYSLLYAIDGYNPKVYHAASLFFHLCNIVFLFYLLRLILSDNSKGMSIQRIQTISIVCTLFFAIHPLQVESVAWISASKIVFSTFFYLLASCTFIQYIKGKSFFYYVSTIVLFLLAYLTKEQSVTFPLWATLLYLWYGRTPSSPSFWYTLSPLYVFALLCGLHLLYPIFSYGNYVSGTTYPWWQRLVFSFYSYSTYLFKYLFPTQLSWMYRFPVPLGSALPGWMLLYPILVCIIIFSFWRQICNKYVVSALVFTFVHLLFVLHFIVLPRAAIIADRYMYLPILGFSFLYVYIITSGYIMRRWKKAVVLLLMLQIAFYCVSSYSRTKDWENSQILKNELYRDTEDALQLN